MARWGNLAGLVGLLAALVVGFGLRAPHFWSAATFQTIVNQIPDALLLAVAMTLVLLIGGIDLSIGSVLGLCSGVLGLAIVGAKWSPALAIGAAVLTGLVCGLVNGLVVVRARIPAFIATLGMLEAARGATYLVTGSRTQYLAGALDRLADAGTFKVSPAMVLAILVAVVVAVALRRTVFGRNLLAIGGSEEASFLAGVATDRVKIGVYALSGLLAGVAACVSAGRLGASDPNAGTGAELQAIAAAVIGGTSLLGGRGSIAGSALGVLVLAVLGNGLVQVGAEEPHKRLITGVVMVLAVLVDALRSRGAFRSRARNGSGRRTGTPDRTSAG